MKKYLRVIMETNYDSETGYAELEGDETEAQLHQIAADVFNNFASYGFRVVDESDVPVDER